MKVIIAGSRTITDASLIERAVEDAGFTITQVVSGCQKTRDRITGKIVGGVDWLGECWAAQHGVSIERFPADWDELGRAAGPIRNAEMAKYADALILIHNGSKGSLSMLALAQGWTEDLRS